MVIVQQLNNLIKMLKVSMLMNLILCVIDNVNILEKKKFWKFNKILFFLVIQHLILEGHTTDAIEKTKELFPTLLNNKNLLFVLKVRQFIEMINGTESEISSPSTSSHITNSLSLKHKHHSNSPSYKKHSSRSSSPITKPNTSSRSRSNSPYTSGTNSGAQQHTNSTTNSLSRRSSANNTELPQGKFYFLAQSVRINVYVISFRN